MAQQSGTTPAAGLFSEPSDSGSGGKAYEKNDGVFQGNAKIPACGVD
jgi:hypothetical protein